MIGKIADFALAVAMFMPFVLVGTVAACVLARDLVRILGITALFTLVNVGYLKIIGSMHSGEVLEQLLMLAPLYCSTLFAAFIFGLLARLVLEVFTRESSTGTDITHIADPGTIFP